MPQDFQLSAGSGSFARGRSLIGRFKAPLASWNKSVADFQIEPDDPWKCYAPGEVVSGTVVLTVIKPIRITHVVVCLHGYARVFKNQTGPGDAASEVAFLGAGRGRRGTEYHGNGFLTLFEDEVVLCRDGRLKEGVYKFKFELEFPTTELPSSIEFERGIIGYSMTATVTRPTTIAPTLSSERKVHFQDAIDVAAIPTPRPKVISLEPISKRGRVKNKVVTPSIDQQLRRETPLSRSRTNTDTSISVRTMAETRPETVLEDEPPRSPAPSESSQASIATESSQSFRIVQQQAPSTNGNSVKSGERSSTTSISDAAITATTELLRPGALPGDNVPIKVTVRHTKPVRGIALVTLYRQGRIDMHPVLPLGPQTKGKSLEYEHLYPRSKTGLGGLHFSNATPSSIFRKDLSQSTAPMIINPATLTAEIKANVKLPEDAFPTIVNVPGAMIMFKYFVEVVIDLCGKLNESRLLPKLSLTTPSSSFAPDGTFNQGRNLTSNWADRIIDTDPVRRTKNIVSCVFELTVGSRDTSRAAKKWKQVEQESNYEDQPYGEHGWEDPYYYYGGYNHEWSEEEWRAWYADSHHDHNYWPDHGHADQYPPQQYVPPPQPEEQVDEKTRLRRLEEQLLPSQPPQDGQPGPSSSAPVEGSGDIATAPWIPEERYGAGAGPSRPPPSGSGVSSHSVETVIPSRSSRPESEPPQFEPSASHGPGDDKQDLERRRLMAEASVPPGDDEAEAVGESSSSSSSAPVNGEASAPTLHVDDEYHILNAGGPPADHGEHLPQYHR